MGLGDFIHGVEHATGHFVSDVAHTGVDLVKAGGEVAKGGAWAVNPTHWDDIGRGVGDVGQGLYHAGQFVAEHPRETLDIAGKVGTQILKDQLKPKNLLITGGLIAATALTGGAAAPALAAEIGEGAVEAGEAGAAISSGISATKAATEGVEATQTLSRTQKFMQGAQQIGSDIKEASGFQKIDKVLSAPTELMGNAREAVGLSRYGMMASARAGVASKILGEAPEEAGVLARSAANVVSGGAANSAWEGPTSTASKMMNRVNMVQSRFNQVKALPQQAAHLGMQLKTGRDVLAFAGDPSLKQGAVVGGDIYLMHKTAIDSAATKGLAQAEEHGVTGHLGSLASHLFQHHSDDKTAEPEKPFEAPAMPDTTQATGLMQYRFDRSHATRTTRRQPGEMGQVGTVTTNTQMPTQIGPSDWYGPQSGYNAGRGFQQPSALPGLEQPNNLTSF